MKRIFNILFSFLFILVVLLSIIDFCCFDRKFYHDEYNKIHTAEYIGVSEEDLDNMTDVLLSYLKDRDNTLDVRANVKGEDREVFNQRERDHMVDVRELYLGAMTVRNVALVVFIVILIYLISQKNTIGDFFSGYKKAMALWGIVFVTIGIACLIDFNSFWNFFHTIFFTNDLWLLDMRTDILIMMVPGQFFFDLVTRIVIYALLSIIITFVILYLLNRKPKYEN